MTIRLSYGTVRHTPRKAIFALRIHDVLLEPLEIEEIAERMRERLALRGELTAEVVVFQGDTKETLRLYGNSYAANLVRTAVFNMAISWSAIDL